MLSSPAVTERDLICATQSAFYCGLHISVTAAKRWSMYRALPAWKAVTMELLLGNLPKLACVSIASPFFTYSFSLQPQSSPDGQIISTCKEAKATNAYPCIHNAPYQTKPGVSVLWALVTLFLITLLSSVWYLMFNISRTILLYVLLWFTGCLSTLPFQIIDLAQSLVKCHL